MGLEQSSPNNHMALNWNLKDVPDHIAWAQADKEWPGEHNTQEGKKYLRPETNALIWLTLGVGLGRITEKNCTEFWYRYQVLEALLGHVAPTHSEGSAEYWNKRDGTNVEAGDQLITYECVRNHIGLATNVSDEPRAKWFKRHFDEAVRMTERHDKEAAE